MIERTTRQLLLRRPDAVDEADYLALFRQPEVEAWLRPAPLAPFAEAELRQMLYDDLEHWQRSGFGPCSSRTAAATAATVALPGAAHVSFVPATSPVDTTPDTGFRSGPQEMTRRVKPRNP